MVKKETKSDRSGHPDEARWITTFWECIFGKKLCNLFNLNGHRNHYSNGQNEKKKNPGCSPNENDPLSLMKKLPLN